LSPQVNRSLTPIFANYKIPKTFELTPELPRLPIGKIDKQALKRELVRRTTDSESRQSPGD